MNQTEEHKKLLLSSFISAANGNINNKCETSRSSTKDSGTYTPQTNAPETTGSMFSRCSDPQIPQNKDNERSSSSSLIDSSAGKFFNNDSKPIPSSFLEHPEICQPSKDYVFPKQSFGKQLRAFQHSWFERFTWLHYCESSDSVLCYYCSKMPMNGCTKKDEAFVSKGFRNWKKALEKFKEHEISDCHRTANDEISIQKQGHDIAESLVSDHEKQKEYREIHYNIG